MRAFLIVAALSVSSVALAKELPPPEPPVSEQLVGKYALDFSHLNKPCVKATAKLAKKVKPFTCRPGNTSEVESGKAPFASCFQPKHPDAGYFFYVTQSDCNDERVSVLANAGDGGD